MRPELYMRASPVAIIVVPRERFSYAARSLDSIYEHTTGPFDLVYVDGNSPRAIRRHLEVQAAQRGFRLLRSEEYLTPNQARNWGERNAADAKHIVFVDNDVLVHPGWLDALLACADETDASIVGPLYLAGEPGSATIHMAAGTAHFSEREGKRTLHVKHNLAGRDFRVTALQRSPCELVEFHCMLVRRSVFDELGSLDERLMSALEHEDLCLAVRARGGSVYFEPAAKVTYIPPPPFALSDYPYFMLRWSDAWNTATLRHFQQKWSLASDDHDLQVVAQFLQSHRHLYFERPFRVLQGLVGWRRAAAFELTLNRLAVRMAIGRHARTPVA